MQVFVVVDLETGVAYAVKVCELIGPAYSLKNKILRFIKCSDCIHVIVSSRGTILMYRGYVPYPGKYSLHPRLHSDVDQGKGMHGSETQQLLILLP